MKRCLVIGVAVLLASPSALAQVDRYAERAPTLRFVAGPTTGAVRGNPSPSTPQGGGENNNVYTWGVAVGGERRVLDHLWLGVSGGWSTWTQGSGIDAGYLYRRFDVGVTPRLEVLRLSAKVMMTTFDIAVPVGVTFPFVTVPQRRAFEENVDSGSGWYVGGSASMTMVFRLGRAPSRMVIGYRLEASAMRHANHRRTTFTPTDPAQAPIVQNTDIVDNEVPTYTAAFVFGF